MVGRRLAHAQRHQVGWLHGELLSLDRKLPASHQQQNTTFLSCLNTTLGYCCYNKNVDNLCYVKLRIGISEGVSRCHYITTSRLALMSRAIDDTVLGGALRKRVCPTRRHRVEPSNGAYRPESIVAEQSSFSTTGKRSSSGRKRGFGIVSYSDPEPPAPPGFPRTNPKIVRPDYVENDQFGASTRPPSRVNI